MFKDLPKNRKDAILNNSKWYYTGKPCLRRHLSKRFITGVCLECNKENGQKRFKEDPEYFIKRNREKIRLNPEENRKRSSLWNKENKQRYNLRIKKWKIKHLIKYKLYLKEYGQRKRQNPLWKLNHNIGHSIWKWLKGKKGGRHWETLVSFTKEELKIHLEKQFVEGMTWENYGPFWHVDHIKPLSLCKTFEEAWQLSNLQPLKAEDNLSKGNRYIGSPSSQIEVIF